MQLPEEDLSQVITEPKLYSPQHILEILKKLPEEDREIIQQHIWQLTKYALDWEGLGNWK